MMRRTDTYAWRLMTIFLLLLAGCGLDNRVGKKSSSQGAASEELQRAVRGLLELAGAEQGNCVDCHGDGKANARWALSNPDAASKALVPFLNKTDIGKSRLIEKSQDGHFGVGGRQLALQRWIAAVTEVVKAMNSLEQANGTVPGITKGAFITSKVTIPTSVPTYNATSTNAFHQLTIPLSSAKPEVGNASLKLKIAMDATIPNTYRVYDVRLDNPTTTAVKIVAPRFILNGTYNSLVGNTYEFVSLVAQPNTTPLVDPLPVPIPKRGNTDELSVSFEELATVGSGAAPTTGCQQLATFTNAVLPLFGKCITCHGQAGGVGTGKFNFSGGDNAGKCLTIRSRTVKTNIDGSDMWVRPANGSHSAANAFTAAEWNTIKSWLNSEVY